MLDILKNCTPTYTPKSNNKHLSTKTLVQESTTFFYYSQNFKMTLTFIKRRLYQQITQWNTIKHVKRIRDTHKKMSLKNFLEKRNSDTQEYIPTWFHLHEVWEQAKLIHYDWIYYNQNNGCIWGSWRFTGKMSDKSFDGEQNSIELLATWVHTFVRVNQILHQSHPCI